MNVELIFSGGNCKQESARGKNAVVIDVLRATSVIVTALENGASAVVPFASVEKARRFASGRRESVILGGERRAMKIKGFDCGNSPFEYTAKRVAGKDVALTTTNGTRAIANTGLADRLFILCMRNIGAVAEKITGADRDLVVVCSGTDGNFSAEDALCAGLFLDRLGEGRGVCLDDAGSFARDFARMCLQRALSPQNILAECAHLRRLREKGFEADLDYCLTIDASEATPVFHEDRLILP